MDVNILKIKKSEKYIFLLLVLFVAKKKTERIHFTILALDCIFLVKARFRPRITMFSSRDISVKVTP